LAKGRKRALLITKNYYSPLFAFENSENRKFRNKKPEIFRIILRSYARNVSTSARKKSMLNDINKNDDRLLDQSTFDEYVEALNDLYVISDINAWNPN
jgi:predicted AAA+ superfamily ATPase